MCKFYCLKPIEVKNLDALTHEVLWKAITVLEATEMKNQLIISCFPDLKESSRKDILNNLNRQSKIVKNKKISKEVDNSEIDSWLRGVLGG